MTDLEAIERRVSRRAFIPEPLKQEDIAAFEKLMEEANHNAGLHLQLVTGNGSAFEGFGKSYGMFSGVRHYFAMIGKCADMCLNEKLGYYGEKLVLEAVKRGLGSCWVGGTFDKKSCPCPLMPDELLECVIVLGQTPDKPGFKERMIYRMAHRGTKAVENFYTAREEPPEWFLSGVRAVQKAPSSLNKQPVRLRYEKEKAFIEVPDYATHQSIDLGIAKLHFELAAKGQWALGNGAVFHKAP